MSKPLVLPTQEGEPWELASSPDGELSEKRQPLGLEPGRVADKTPDAETVTTDLPRESSREVSVDRPDPQPGPEDPVPMSVDSVDPAIIPTPGSDESWTELYDRTCGDPTPTAGDRGREKRPRSPDFVPEKRPKHDGLPAAFVTIRKPLKPTAIFSWLP